MMGPRLGVHMKRCRLLRTWKYVVLLLNKRRASRLTMFAVLCSAASGGCITSTPACAT